jgi:hypothetical protein
MSPPCPSHGDGQRTYHYPPTDRRSVTVSGTWTRAAEARRLAAAHVRTGVNLTAPERRFGAIGWTGETLDVEDRWGPERHRVFEAADGRDYAVLVLGYENRTVLETFHVAGYC